MTTFIDFLTVDLEAHFHEDVIKSRFTCAQRSLLHSQDPLRH